MSERAGTRNGLTWAQAVVVFFGGGLLISLGDRAHIEFGVLTQNNTSFLGQAWWVVPMFGAVSLTLIRAKGAGEYRPMSVALDHDLPAVKVSEETLREGVTLVVDEALKLELESAIEVLREER